MFGWFRKKTKGPVVTDKICLNLAAKYSILRNWMEQHPGTSICWWFEDSFEAAKAAMYPEDNNPPMLLARDVHHAGQLTGSCIFGEHHPLLVKENQLYEKLHLESIVVFSSLSDPLLLRFGGERIMEMMKSLGMDETAPVEHALLTRAIKNAQEKIARKVDNESFAYSASEWFTRNYPDV